MSTSNPVGQQVVVDRNKPTEQYIKEAEKLYIVPRLVREKFPDLVKLIYETESMDGDEREYWLQIMPIMTEEQIKKFRDILVNEKEQLAKLDTEYAKEMSRINNKHVAEIDEAKMKEKMQNIRHAEAKEEVTEKGKEEDVLNKLKDL